MNGHVHHALALILAAFVLGPGVALGADTENTPEACQDKKDNDGDGWIDCSDEECQPFAFCDTQGTSSAPVENTLEACSDAADNDGDGYIDCMDQDCKFFAICTGGQTGSPSLAPGSVCAKDTDCDKSMACIKGQCIKRTLAYTQSPGGSGCSTAPSKGEGHALWPLAMLILGWSLLRYRNKPDR